jgi:hypothetical protein
MSFRITRGWTVNGEPIAERWGILRPSSWWKARRVTREGDPSFWLPLSYTARILPPQADWLGILVFVKQHGTDRGNSRYHFEVSGEVHWRKRWRAPDLFSAVFENAGVNGYPPGHYLLLCRTCRSRPKKHAHSTHCGITKHPLCLYKDLFFSWKISFVTSVCILPLVRAFDWVGCVNVTSEQKEFCIILITSTCNIYFLI